MSDAILITPTKKQIEAFRALDNNQIVLFGGAIRGSKTWWGCLAIITFCFQYENSRWLMLRESLPTLKRTLLVTFNELLAKGFGQYVKEFNQQTQTLTWNNGSQIIFMSESFDTDKELNRFRGLEINGAFIDEANEIQEATFNKVIERAGSWFHSKGCPIKILMSANPCQNWLKERIYDKCESDTLPNGVAYVPATIFDNPHIPAEYLESLKSLPEYEYDVFVNGNWSRIKNVESPFAWAFAPDKHIQDCYYDENKTIYISMDFNISPFAVIFSHIYRDNGVEVVDIFDEMSIDNGSIPLMAQRLKDRFGTRLFNSFVTGDFNGNNRQITSIDNASLYEQLIRLCGLNNKHLQLSRNPTHQKSRNDCNFILSNYPRLRISPKCKGLIRDLRSVQVDIYGEILKRNRKDINQQSDLLDAFQHLAIPSLYSQCQRWHYHFQS